MLHIKKVVYMLLTKIEYIFIVHYLDVASHHKASS
jgi:hypothetical protein